MKYCSGCEQTKELTEFGKHSGHRDGLASRCKVCKTASAKKYLENNREKERARKRKYLENNPEKVRASKRKSNQRPEAKKKRRAWHRERRKTDPQFRLACNLRSRVGMALKRKNKSAKTMKLLGCSYMHLQDYLTMRFQPGMTWENYGKWHADHMMPCASFDLEDPEQQRQCFHYTNLQPMWASENISKKDKILYNRTWNGTRWVSI
jgi:hypothetical protein